MDRRLGGGEGLESVDPFSDSFSLPPGYELVDPYSLPLDPDELLDPYSSLPPGLPLLDPYYSSLPPGPPLFEDDADYREALQFGKVLVAYARVMLIGPGGVGKSSFLLGLANKLLKSATSTQLAEMLTFKPVGSRATRHDLQTSIASPLSWSKASGSPESPWSEVTEDDETDEIIGLIQLVANVTKGRKTSSRFVQMIQNIATAVLQSELTSCGGIPGTSYQTEVMKTVEEILSRAVQQAKQHPHAQAPESEVMLHVWDCGGQPVFLDVLPPFLTSRTMFLMMFDARRKLQEKCVARSYQEGQILKEEVYQDITTLELMLQWMASIHANLATRDVHHHESEDVHCDPCILPIGTHGDDPTVKSRKKEILKEISSECEQKAFSYLLRPQGGVIVDNTTAGKGDSEDPAFKDVRKEVYNFADNNLKIATPITWVLFRKVFKKVASKSPVVSLDEARAIGEACGIPEDTFSSVLKFYHELAVFFHYAHIPSLSQHVIADPRWLIRHLGKLLALEGFEEMKGSPLWKPLREKGILLQPLYEALWKGCELPPKSLIDLLEHFLLLSPLSSKVCSFPGQEYFIPAVLKQFHPDQDPVVSTTAIFRAAPLHLLFNTLQVPPGFFTRLATSLAKEKNTHVVFNQGVYRNRITILYGKAHSKIDKIIITQLSSSIQVEVTRVHRRQSHDPFFTTVCRDILKLIQECSASILEWLPGITVTPSFTCEQCESQPQHFVEFQSTATTLSLLHCEQLQMVLPNQPQRFWLKISPEEEDLCGNPPSNTELVQLVKEFPEQKIRGLVENLEMTAHQTPEDHSSLDLQVVLRRYLRDMAKQELHTRSHLVHHLRSIGLTEIANKLKYQEYCATTEDGAPCNQPATTMRPSQQAPLTTADLAVCSWLITEPNLKFLASMLNISDDELDNICSHYKYPQGQAYQVLDLWYKRSTNHQKRQDLIDALENASFFDAARRLKAESRKPNLAELLKHVTTSKWHGLGVFLGVDPTKLGEIRQDTRESDDALSRVFETWLQTEQHPTWKKVVQALKDLGLLVLATEIKDRFC